MGQPTTSDVHVNAPLTMISVAFLQDQSNFIADQVFPNIPVSKQTDRYWTYDRGMFNRDEMKERAPGTESEGIDYTIDSTPTYYCPVYALHYDIDDQTRANADSAIDLDRDATELLTRKAWIRREKLFVTKFFTTGKWGKDVAGVPNGVDLATEVLQWSDPNSTPIEDVRRWKTYVMELCGGFEPNTLVLGQRSLDALLDHPDIIDRVKYGQTAGRPAMIDVSELVALFKVPRILVMKAVENTAAEGATNVHSFIGGKHALLVYAAPRPSMLAPSGGYTFSWSGWFGASGQGHRIKRFREEKLESDRIEIQMAMEQKIIAPECGVFFNGVVA